MLYKHCGASTAVAEGNGRRIDEPVVAGDSEMLSYHHERHGGTAVIMAADCVTPD